MTTLQDARADKFPFKEGDRVKVKWANFHSEFGEISKLYTSVQCGINVVYALTVLIDGADKPRGVSQEILEKVN